MSNTGVVVNQFDRGQINRAAVLALFIARAKAGRPSPTFEEIGKEVQISQTAIFQHLRALVRQGTLQHRAFQRRGYELNPALYSQAVQRSFDYWWEDKGRDLSESLNLDLEVKRFANLVWMASRGL